MGSLDLQQAIMAFGADMQRTLEAAHVETDPNRLAALVIDLEHALPARRDAILSSVASKAGSAGRATLEAAVHFVATVGVAIGKALVAGAL